MFSGFSFPHFSNHPTFPIARKKNAQTRKRNTKQIKNWNTCLVKNNNKTQERMLQRGKLSDLGLNSKQSNIRLSFSSCVASPPLGLLSSNSPISPLVLTVGPGTNHSSLIWGGGSDNKSQVPVRPSSKQRPGSNLIYKTRKKKRQIKES